VVYQFHALFRAFLRQRALDCFTEDDLCNLNHRAATLLITHDARAVYKTFAAAKDTGWQLGCAASITEALVYEHIDLRPMDDRIDIMAAPPRPVLRYLPLWPASS
jgi:predicted outer membrane lipoprotein